MSSSVSLLEKIQIPHFPADLSVYAALYRDVTNAAFLREQLMAGNEAFEYAFVDASMVISRQHALAAVFRAVNDYLNDRLKSRNVHSEIVFSFSSTNNIGEAFRRFGVSDTTKALLVFKIPTKPEITEESVTRHLSENIQGTPVPFDDEHIRQMTDLPRIRKIHKLGAGDGGKGGKSAKTKINGSSGGVGMVVDERREIEIQVLGLMALRGAA